jgi:cell division protein FtsW
MERKMSHCPDRWLLIVLFVLIMLGFLILSSASISYSQKEFGSPLYILLHQLKIGILPGILIGILFFNLPLDFVRKYSLFFMLFVLFLTSMVFIPSIGVNVGGSSRWIRFGSLQFQPSEFLKLASIIYIAAWLSKWKSNPQDGNKKIFSRKNLSLKGDWAKKSISFLVIISSVIILLFFQPDFSTLGIIILAAISMYFVANPGIRTILLIVLILVILMAAIPLSGYRMDRILVFLNPGGDPMGSGYQISQSLIAIGSGGLWGKGLGFGVQKLGFLPQPIADSIFSVFAEETGFIGSIILIFLFLLFAIIGFKISKNSPNTFLKTLSLGIVFWIVFQAFVNIGSVMGIVPLTGIPLPFIANGGSHLLAELAGAGLLLNISKYSVE